MIGKKTSCDLNWCSIEAHIATLANDVVGMVKFLSKNTGAKLWEWGLCDWRMESAKAGATITIVSFCQTESSHAYVKQVWETSQSHKILLSDRRCASESSQIVSTYYLRATNCPLIQLSLLTSLRTIIWFAVYYQTHDWRPKNTFTWPVRNWICICILF